MNIEFGPELESFRREVAEFLDVAPTPAIREAGKKTTSVFAPFEQVMAWHRILHAKGWAAPAWPKQYGGTGWSVEQRYIFAEECRKRELPPLLPNGLQMVGPMLIELGSEEQKRKHLPGILSGEDYWTQGYSEPNAGSDLASLQCSAVADGDDYIINGSKIWTTLAHHSNRMFMLVRTSKTGKKQEGITFLLLDRTDYPGMEIRPIIGLDGFPEQCEVFFDNVRVPAENLVGELHKGWTIAKALLGHERLFVGSPRYVKGAMDRLDALAAASGGEAPGFSPDRYTKLHLDYQDFLALYADYSNFVKNGGELGAEASILKLLSSETYQAVTEEILSMSAEAGIAAGGGNQEQAEAATMFFQSRPSTIAGGTSQVQRNIIAKAVLNLPSA